ncbi:MAG: peptide chain release factor N(5)-glutamine methyltransferase [Oligoflexales bacterium]|nr:peptide chain release factor N(5)-glutamine methyltransferase [Oligoflexales bacterium]
MSKLLPGCSIGEARAFCKAQLEESNNENSGLDADLLITTALKIDRMHLYAYPEKALSDPQLHQLLALLSRRKLGEPMAYILGKKEFFGRDYLINPHALIPRPETELLVESALSHLRGRENQKVLEVGSGSGCIAISIKLESPKTYVESWDVSSQVLQLAKENSSLHGAQVSFKLCDALKQSNWQCNEKFGLLVSNPPYIAYDELKDLDLGVKDFEPHTALFASDDGLAFYKTFAQYGPRILNPNGVGIFEIGYSQADKITEIFKLFGWDVISVIKDYADKHRLVVASYSDN